MSTNVQQLRDEVTTNISVLAASVQQLRDQLSTNLSAMMSDLSAVAAAVVQLEAGVPPTSCGNFTLANGAAFGHGNLAGATRVLQCNDGFILTGVATSVVVCHVDGNWSDFGAARCSAASPSPTSAPTPTFEWVQCLVAVDQELMSVWADGQRLSIELNQTLASLGGGWAGRIWSFRFPSTVQVLGLRVLNDGGCRYGYVLIQGGFILGRMWIIYGNCAMNVHVLSFQSSVTQVENYDVIGDSYLFFILPKL